MKSPKCDQAARDETERALRCSCQIADMVSHECARLGKCKERVRLRAALGGERERCALKAYREIIAAVDDVRLANTIRDAIREGEL